MPRTVSITLAMFTARDAGEALLNESGGVPYQFDGGSGKHFLIAARGSQSYRELLTHEDRRAYRGIPIRQEGSAYPGLPTSADQGAVSHTNMTLSLSGGPLVRRTCARSLSFVPASTTTSTLGVQGVT